MYRARRILLLLMLAIIVASVAADCEGCRKDYTISGIVTDANFTPLADVQVFLQNSLLTTTDVNGQYSARFPSNDQFLKEIFSYLIGERVVFVKTGYRTVEADAFNVAEAGPTVCGSSITLKRDAVLQLE